MIDAILEAIEALTKRIRKLETQDPGPAWYIQATDPGAVGAGALWIDTTTQVLSYRDDTDTSWVNVV